MSEFYKSDKDFSKLIIKSKLELPFSDFEENVMYQIKREGQRKHSLPKELKFASFFFLLGTFLGLKINNFLQESGYSFPGIPTHITSLIFQIVFMFLFLTQLERFITVFQTYKKGASE